MKVHLRLIGDVHGHVDRYVKLAQKSEYSIQLGDLSFNYNALNALDSAKHKVLAGNHDNYTEKDGKFIEQTPHFLGDYGVHTVPEVGDFFYVRGAKSIDKNQRTLGVNWFPHEEISYSDCMKAYDLYREVRPDVVISHECPESIIDMISGFKTWDGAPIRPSMTAVFLEQLFEHRRPNLWLFGHHHKKFDMEVYGTRFVCLPELDCFDFKIKGD